MINYKVLDIMRQKRDKQGQLGQYQSTGYKAVCRRLAINRIFIRLEKKKKKKIKSEHPTWQGNDVSRCYKNP